MDEAATSPRRRRDHDHRQISRNSLEKRGRQALFSQRAGERQRPPPPPSSAVGGGGGTASEAQSIQRSLMRTQGLLRNELRRVSNISDAIEEDETVLRQTVDHHKSLNTGQAKKALTALQRAQRQEERTLNASIVFFCAVALYVMWSRVLIKFDFVSVILDWIV